MNKRPRISRGAAHARKLQFYYEGPCEFGHTANRNTFTAECTECANNVRRHRIFKTPLTEKDWDDYHAELGRIRREKEAKIK